MQGNGPKGATISLGASEGGTGQEKATVDVMRGWSTLTDWWEKGGRVNMKNTLTLLLYHMKYTYSRYRIGGVTVVR